MNSVRKFDGLFLVIAALIYVVLYFAITERLITPFWSMTILVIIINIVLASSLNLINGFTGQFSIGHAGFMAIGAYISAVLTTNFDMHFVVGLLGGAIGAGILGLIVGLPTLRLQGDYLAIATLGLSEIIRICILNIEYIGGAAGFSGIPKYTTFTWAFWVMVITLLILKNFIRSNYGRACIAIRENEIAAEAMGINTTRYKVMAFTIGAFFAGIAGGLFAHLYYIIQPQSFTFIRSFEILAMVVLGGLGSMTGSVLGAILIAMISALLASWPEMRMIVYSMSLVLLMNFRPQGILGTKEFSHYMLKRFFHKGGKKDVA